MSDDENLTSMHGSTFPPTEVGIPTFQSCMIHSKTHDKGRNAALTINENRWKSKSTECAPSKTKDSGTSVWNVRDFDSLRDVATVVPLERTNILLYGFLPKEVAKKILVCLKYLSIAIIRKPKAKLLVESLDHVQFYIRLFKKVDGAEKAIVVELQRKNGCSLSYIAMVRKIFEEVKNGYEKGNNTFNKLNNIQSIPTSCSKFNGRTYKEMEEEKTFTLKIAADNLVRCDLMDVKLIAWESLRALTDTGSTQPEVSLAAAIDILHGKDDIHQDVKRSIFQYVSHPHHDECCHDATGERYYLIMHNHALAVLANILRLVLESSDKLESIIQSDEWTGDEGVLWILIKELRCAEKRPHDAYQAMRCINSLIGVSSGVKNRAIELGVQSAITLSQNVGHCSHALLAQETDIGMAMVENSPLMSVAS